VVWVAQRRSNEALFRELKDSIGLEQLKAEGVAALYRIGDCEAPRLTADAVFSGHRLAREIDSPDPSIPLPFKRERRMVDDASVAMEKADASRRGDGLSWSSVKQVLQLGDEVEFTGDGLDVDPDYLDPALNEWDSFATEEALQLRERLGGEVVVVTCGPKQSEAALRRCLAMGADRAIRVEGAGRDPFSVARALAEVVRAEADIVFCGVSRRRGAGGDRHGAGGLLGLPRAAVV
jgi:hypothetical protein